MARSYAASQSYYRSAPSKVFKAMTDPKILVKWFLSGAKVVPKNGGTYSFDWIGGYRMDGTVKRFEDGSAVAYSWHDKMSNGKTVETLASFRITRKGRGTILNLRHSGFKDPEHFAECSARWAYYLTNMKSVLDEGIDLRSRNDW